MISAHEDVAIGRMQKSLSRLRARADGHDTPFTVLDAGPHVDEIETYARKLLAAVAWHRHLSTRAAS